VRLWILNPLLLGHIEQKPAAPFQALASEGLQPLGEDSRWQAGLAEMTLGHVSASSGNKGPKSSMSACQT